MQPKAAAAKKATPKKAAAPKAAKVSAAHPANNMRVPAELPTVLLLVIGLAAAASSSSGPCLLPLPGVVAPAAAQRDT